MPAEPFNGWANKATFDVAYAFETDTTLCRRASELATRCTSATELAKALDQLCEEVAFKQCPFDGTGISILRRSLIGDALDSVDWNAIAKQRIVIRDGLKP